MVVREKSGYTLIEILVTIAILSIIAGVTITTYLTAYRSYVSSQILNQLQEDGERIMKQLERSVRSSTNALLYSSGSTYYLELTLDVDSLEYQQNGNCQTIRYRRYNETGSANGRIELQAPGCGSLIGGGSLNDTDPLTGVSIIGVTYAVVDNVATDTQSVTITMTLQQGVDSTTRTQYEVTLPMQTVVNTRQYVR
jgi:prepilin-type N-terminal cleavage/methylation domain-containing protein